MSNPFFEDWDAPFGAPPLDRIEPRHFVPAYDRALAEHTAEIAAIAGNEAPPSFDNVIVALEKSGRLLTRVDSVFHNLTSSATNDELQALELEMAPRLSAHWSAISMHPVLFARLDRLFQERASLGLDNESLKVLERYHLDFVRAGAQLKGEARDRLADIAQRLASLSTQFCQNVLGDEEDWILPLTQAQMAGVPQSICDAAASKAAMLKIEQPFAITLSRSSVEPFLQYADDRALREQLFRAWTARGDNDNTRNNKAVMGEMLELRSRRATLLGYENFAAFKLDDSMAGTPAKARALLEEVWEPARLRALQERDALQDFIARDGGNFRLAPWDWRYYAEKLRQEKYDFDEAQLKPYFQFEQPDRSRLLYRATLVRPQLPRTPRHAGLSSRCAGVGSAARGCRDRAVLWRLFRPSRQAERRLDVQLPRPGGGQRASAAHHPEQLQFCEKRSLPAVVRRCRDGVP